jgi:hypothetical protein
MKLIQTKFALLFTLSLLFTQIHAAETVHTQSVHFDKGTSGTTIKGKIQGYESYNYTLSAKAGQTMKVKLSTKHGATYFNIYAPGKAPGDEAMFIGASNGTSFKGELPADGRYIIQVFMMRSAARRNEVANYSLSVEITGGSKLPHYPSHDAKVPGTPYHATGDVECKLGDTSKGYDQCPFGVIRKGLGVAQVDVTPPGGLKRKLHFDHDRVTTGSDEKIKAHNENGMWIIEVNDYEHYKIFESVIVGG